MIILDPNWKLFWLCEHSSNQRHNLFASVGKKLAEDSVNGDPTFHRLSALVEPAERALLSIMHAVAGEEGRTRVQDFLDQFAGTVLIQKPPA